MGRLLAYKQKLMNTVTRTLLAAATSVMILFPACTSEPKSFEDEVRHLYQDNRGFFYLKIPPALLTLALSVADDPGMNRFFGDARQVGLISFGEGIPASESKEIIRNLEEMLTRYQYEELIRISDSGRLINMRMKENSGRVTDLVTIISETDGQLMAITLSGDIDIEQIVMMAADFDFGQLMELRAMGGRR
ncbi:MAG: DUF4252 domain-containing protein [Marinilabiliales bacterium]|nr:MAG: DUF4252 domain-containing protein [Marinilabiliales bacterium]